MKLEYGDTLKVISTNGWSNRAQKLTGYKFILNYCYKPDVGSSVGVMYMTKKEMKKFKFKLPITISMKDSNKDFSYCRMLLVEKAYLIG